LQKIKDYFKEWTLFEIALTVFSLVVIVTVSIVFQSWWAETLVAVISIIYYMLYSKGKIEANIFAIIAGVFYAWVAWSHSYYGESIEAIAVEIPIAILCLVFWTRRGNNQKDQRFGKVIKFNKPGVGELVAVVFVTTLIGVGAYFGLRAMNTTFLIVSTISVCASVAANYLSLRRSTLNWYSWLLNDATQIALWTYIVATTSISTMPVLVSIIILHIINVYGFINWVRLERRQSNLAKSDIIVE